jgi:proteic killer suppression protein
MIKSFKAKKTEAFYRGKAVKEFLGFKKVGERKLTMLARAAELGDLLASPANRLEKLKENRAGQHSIRINDQWRICFV